MNGYPGTVVASSQALWITYASLGAILFIAGAFWLFNDASERFGPEMGCFAFLLYLAFAPMFFLTLPGYYLIVVLGQRAGSGPREDAKVYFPSDALGRRGLDTSRGSSAFAEIAEEERVEELDELIAKGELETALKRASELLNTAKEFHDERGISRFSKYLRIIKEKSRK